MMHPFDQPEVIAGQGTLGIEIEEQVPGVDVILMGVRDQDRFDLLISDRFEIRQRILTSVLGMHPAIEHQSMAAHLEIV